MIQYQITVFMYKLILIMKPYHAERVPYKVMLNKILVVILILITNIFNTQCISWYIMYLDSII